MKPKDILTKKFLLKHYVKQRKSVDVIVREQGIKSNNSVTQALLRHDITRTSSSEEVGGLLNKEFLLYHYTELKKSALTIAEETGYSKPTILRHLKKHDIKIRSKAECHDSPKMRKYWTGLRTGYKDISGRYWTSVISGAKRRNLQFEITNKQCWKLFIKQKRKCAISGVSIRFYSVGEPHFYQTASLDRIDSSKGYVIDNVQWVHKAIQRMKWSMEQAEFITWCRKIVEHANNILS